MQRHYALVPAAGVGSRMGAHAPKQYLPLAGRTVLWHALAALAATPRIARVWVVIGPDDAWFDRNDWSAFADKLTTVRCGGASRAASVLNGLRAMQPQVAAADWVLVHDAARPCVTVTIIDRLIDAVGEDDAGGILAVPIADTVKRAGADSRIVETVPRDGLWSAQTPQMFRHAALRDALAGADLGGVTDEASAMERTGVKPRLVMSSTRNIKITVPDDLALAERHLLAETG